MDPGLNQQGQPWTFDRIQPGCFEVHYKDVYT